MAVAAPTPQVNPPDTPPVDIDGDKGKTYTEDELQQKLRGSGTRIKSVEAERDALQAKIAEYSKLRDDEDRKKLEEKGEYQKLREQDEATIKAKDEALLAARKIITDREAADKTKADALKAKNDERIEALSEEQLKLIPVDLLSPEAMAVHISEVEKLDPKFVDVAGGAPRGGGKPQTPQEHINDVNEQLRKITLGKGK